MKIFARSMRYWLVALMLTVVVRADTSFAVASIVQFNPNTGCFWRGSDGVAHRFELVKHWQNLRWGEAADFASLRYYKGVKGNLATITVGGEDYCVRTMMINRVPWLDGNGAWLGADNLNPQRQFRWGMGAAKNSAINRNLFLWHTNQPNNPATERCLGYMLRGGWVGGNNYPCDAVISDSYFREKMRHYIVEYSAKGTALNP
jgi:hypothetical protein